MCRAARRAVTKYDVVYVLIGRENALASSSVAGTPRICEPRDADRVERDVDAARLADDVPQIPVHSLTRTPAAPWCFPFPQVRVVRWQPNVDGVAREYGSCGVPDGVTLGGRACGKLGWM
jgi:hypothetical protein